MTIHPFDNPDRIALRDLPWDEYLNICRAFRECPARVEYFEVGFRRRDRSYIALYVELPYRVRPIVREAQIPWEHIAKEFRWYAEYADVGAFLFAKKPASGDHVWIADGLVISAKVFSAYIPSEGIEPKDSLRERPS